MWQWRMDLANGPISGNWVLKLLIYILLMHQYGLERTEFICPPTGNMVSNEHSLRAHKAHIVDGWAISLYYMMLDLWSAIG